MGSPPLRIALLAVLAVAGFAALPARADEQGAVVAATSFLQALEREDAAAACGMFSPEALAKLGGLDKCLRAYAPRELPDIADFKAYEQLRDALTAAEKSAVRRRGQFVTKRFGLRSLAREMERIDDDLTVKIGTAKTAVGQLQTTVVLDRRTTARRIVLYVESDGGSILRLSSAMLGDPDIEEVGQGVPEKETGPKPKETFAFQVGAATLLPGGTAYVDATVTYSFVGESYTYGVLFELVPAGAGYLVADLYYSAVDVTETEE